MLNPLIRWLPLPIPICVGVLVSWVPFSPIFLTAILTTLLVYITLSLVFRSDESSLPMIR